MRCSRRLATEAPIASARVVKTVERLEMVWLDLHMLGLRRGYLLWTQAGQHANRVFAVVAACRLSVDAKSIDGPLTKNERFVLSVSASSC
jgi:hypothetical protein